MKWTDEKPREPGWYWHRRQRPDKSWYKDICRVSQFDINIYDDVPRTDRIQWAGPIPEPEE